MRRARRYETTQRNRRIRRALTLIELMVTVAAMAGVLLVVSEIFNAASNTSGLVQSNSELINNATDMTQTLSDDFASIANGLLVIYSPHTTTATPGTIRNDLPATITDMPDVTPFRPSQFGIGTTVAARPTRADMVSFISTARRHESWWYSTIIGNTHSPLASSDALVTYGHGLVAPTSANLTLPPVEAQRWQFLRRAVLLGAPDVGSSPGIDVLRPPTGVLMSSILQYNGTIPTGMPFMPPDIVNGLSDATFNPTRDFVDLMPFIKGRPDDFAALIQRSAVWDTFTDPNLADGVDADYWRRQFARFMPSVGSVTIEWTDGSMIDPRPIPGATPNYIPQNGGVQWFGKPRDASGDGDLSNNAANGVALGNNDLNDAGDVMTKRQWADRWSVQAVPPFRTFDELSPAVVDYVTAGSYFAVWTRDTWDLRPRALRFTVRLYDSNLRIKGEERWPPIPVDPTGATALPPGVNTVLEPRYGREFSFVIPVP